MKIRIHKYYQFSPSKKTEVCSLYACMCAYSYIYKYREEEEKNLLFDPQ